MCPSAPTISSLTDDAAPFSHRPCLGRSGLGRSNVAVVTPYVFPPSLESGLSLSNRTSPRPDPSYASSCTWKRTISPRMTVAVTLPSLLTMSCVCATLHSKWTADSAMRGGATTIEGSGVSPESSISFSSGSQFPHVWFADSTNQSLMMFTTNSPVASTFAYVSLSTPPGLRHTDTAMVGGSCAIAPQYENGATFPVPSALSDDTRAMGRGTIDDITSG
mmetsp:Transcript_11487/g.37774  ORF Transcript_11487/g.37774 Transcript_11487/m.37774 type:complete len:219 (+) Transcript_11487:2781-3437(+)